MTREQLKNMFPHAGKEFLDQNEDKLKSSKQQYGCKPTVSSAVILESYGRLKSVWKVAQEVGLCGQSVHERLVRLGASVSQKVRTESDISRITEVYASGIVKGDGKLDALANELGFTKESVCRIARSLGITDINRGVTEAAAKLSGKKVSEAFKRHGHPKGMLGKLHTQETKDIISSKGVGRIVSSEQVDRMLKTKEKNGTLYPPKHGSWKAAWREIGGKRLYARSRWEANYARYLEFLKQASEILEWEHEPETFWFNNIKRGVRSYLPDFKVTFKDGHVEYHEVKGWMDDRSKTKIKRMKKYYPDTVLVVRDAAWYKANNRTLKSIIPGWE